VGVIAAAVAAVALAASPAAFVQGRQQADGGFAEPGGTTAPGLTSWAVLGLRAAGVAASPAAHDYLVGHEAELEAATDVELAVAAEAVSGGASPALLDRLHGLVRPDGRIGDAVNSTVWGILALRQAGVAVPAACGRWLLRHQTRGGGWGWSIGGAPDSNDTAAAVEALTAVGIRGAPIRRALGYLRTLRRRDGGYALSAGKPSDAQSTAWAAQAFVAAGVEPGRAVWRYLARMRRPDGSLRYSARYAVTPVWVTSQALPALARRPFPLIGQ
jgi:energy-coupling factor transport system substrate-specific component